MAELEEYPEKETLEEKVQWIRNINADTLLNKLFLMPSKILKKFKAFLNGLS